MGRIVYIDSLKGLAILSVIISHVSVFLLVGKINLLSTFVGVYMMPLFFVLSGLVITEMRPLQNLLSLNSHLYTLRRINIFDQKMPLEVIFE